MNGAPRQSDVTPRVGHVLGVARWCMDAPVSGSVVSCAACRVIDRADGVEDGKLYKSEHYPLGNERRIVAAIKRSEDRLADRVTAFAGSLNFVYIHAMWFGIWIAINAGLVGASV